MKILFVSNINSIHTVRWINQLKDTDFKLFIFPTFDNCIPHEDLNDITICIPFRSLSLFMKRLGLSKHYNFIYRSITSLINKISPKYYSKRLSRYIKTINPQLIHTLETQGSGYLTMAVKEKYFSNKNFPKWWHTNWGSDIYIYGRITSHQSLIRTVMENCDYYSCECDRDIKLAYDFGFKGITLPVYPNTGGFDFEEVNKIKKESKLPSDRKIIMLKGYQGWAGRALVGIRALERCANILSGYSIIIYSNPHGEDILIASKLFTITTGIPINILPSNISHQDILKYHSMARISIGLSIGDAISTSLLEAMVMGSFPIQSSTSCTTEWIQDGTSGFVVPPEDPDIIEIAIRKALADDQMVDAAALLNYNKIKHNAEYSNLKNLTIESYKKILS